MEARRSDLIEDEQYCGRIAGDPVMDTIDHVGNACPANTCFVAPLTLSIVGCHEITTLARRGYGVLFGLFA